MHIWLIKTEIRVQVCLRRDDDLPPKKTVMVVIGFLVNK